MSVTERAPAIPATAEATILHRAQAGDRDAFDWLYERYHDDILQYLYRQGGNFPLAEDLAADTFLKAWPSLTAPSSTAHRDPRLLVRPWLYTIANRTYIDWWRRHGAAQRPVQFVPLQSIFSPEYFGISAGGRGLDSQHREEGAGRDQARYGALLTDDDRSTHPERAALDAELRARVRAALDAMLVVTGQRNPVQRRLWREALVLKVWGDLTYEEVAAVLGMTVFGIKSLLFRARQAFREAWEAQENAQEAQDAP